MNKSISRLVILLVCTMLVISGCSSAHTGKEVTQQQNPVKQEDQLQTGPVKEPVNDGQEEQVQPEPVKESPNAIKEITWAGTVDVMGTGRLADWGYDKDGTPDGHFKLVLKVSEPVKLENISAYYQEFENKYMWNWEGGPGTALLYQNGTMVQKSTKPLLSPGVYEYDFYLDAKPNHVVRKYTDFNTGKKFNFDIEIIKQNGRTEVLNSIGTIN